MVPSLPVDTSLRLSKPGAAGSSEPKRSFPGQTRCAGIRRPARV
jgi:hypothetical protein